MDIVVKEYLGNNGTTLISPEYVISPYIGGGYLNISGNGYSATIDPNHKYQNNGPVFEIKKDDTVLEINTKLKKIIPVELQISAHHKFIHFGRYFCFAKKPKCSECKLRNICKY